MATPIYNLPGSVHTDWAVKQEAYNTEMKKGTVDASLGRAAWATRVSRMRATPTSLNQLLGITVQGGAFATFEPMPGLETFQNFTQLGTPSLGSNEARKAMQARVMEARGTLPPEHQEVADAIHAGIQATIDFNAMVVDAVGQRASLTAG